MQNLNNLDKFVKKHLRQKSVPAIAQKKQSISEAAKKKTHRKNKPTEQIVGLSEIFYPAYNLKDNMVIGKDGAIEELSAILDEPD